MSMALLGYHKQCVDAVIEYIENGEKRITILMPTGTGKHVVIFYILEKMRDKRVLILSDKNIMNRFIEQSLSNTGGTCDSAMISPEEESDWGRRDDYQIVVLYELRPYTRELLRKCGAFKESIVISVGACIYPVGGLDQYSDSLFESMNQMAMEMFKSSTFIPMIYTTNTIFDIRDFDSATNEEKEYLRKKLRHKRNEIAHGVAFFHNFFEKEKADEKIKELEELNAYLQRKLEFDEKLLVASGIDISMVNEYFDRIEKLRNEILKNIYLEDGSMNEAIISKFENEVATAVVQLTKRTLTIEFKERYEDILKGYLTEKVWGLLSEKSKIYLISAKMNFEAMIRMENSSMLDYSGVCLQITKVLDVEMTERLFRRYSDWLKQQYDTSTDILRWPKALTKKKQNGLVNIINDDDFTLGTVKYVLGVDENGNVKNNYAFNLFKRFAKQELYSPGLSISDIEVRIKNIGQYVEKVRTTYRNPAAHRNFLDIISAEACLGYMIETYKKLKEMLEDMKY